MDGYETFDQSWRERGGRDCKSYLKLGKRKDCIYVIIDLGPFRTKTMSINALGKGGGIALVVVCKTGLFIILLNI